MPLFFIWMVKFFCPFIVSVVLILTLLNDFSRDSQLAREAVGWNAGVTWAGRLLWILPIVIFGIGALKPIET